MLLLFDYPGRFLDRNADWLCCLGFLLFVFLVGVLATMSLAVGRVGYRNRRIGPAGVWLNLLPVFHVVWLPVTVERVAESLRAELTDRGLHKSWYGYGRSVGLTAVVLFVCPVVLLPHAAAVTWPFGLIYTIVYWVQLGGYARQLRDDVAPRYAPPADEGW